MPQHPLNTSKYTIDTHSSRRIFLSNQTQNATATATIAAETASDGKPPPIVYHKCSSIIARSRQRADDNIISTAICHGFGLFLIFID